MINSEENNVTTLGIPPVINSFDENALEAALQLKEKHGGRIVAVSIGEKLAKPILTKALAVGADDLILLNDEGFKGVDSYSRAYVLACAVRKIGDYDLILTGMQTSDWGFSQVGIVLAEILGIPSIGNAQSVKIEGSKVVVKRTTRNGYQIVEASIPALITADSLLGELRYPSLNSIGTRSKTSPDEMGNEGAGNRSWRSGVAQACLRNILATAETGRLPYD